MGGLVERTARESGPSGVLDGLLRGAGNSAYVSWALLFEPANAEDTMLISPLVFRTLHRVPALPTFNARQVFGSGTPEDTTVPWLGEHAQVNLLNAVEEATEPTIIREHAIRILARDFATSQVHGIVAELGGLGWAPITLGQFHHLVMTLSRNDCYMAYVRWGDNVFGVHAAWAAKGRQARVRSLHIESGELNRPYGWAEECHVLSQ